MGNAAVVANAGHGPYAIEALLRHKAATGSLTMEALLSVVQHLQISAAEILTSGAAWYTDAEDQAVAMDEEKLYALLRRSAESASKLDVVDPRVDAMDMYALLTPLEAERGFPLALAALRKYPKLSRQVMAGRGFKGGDWLPLHCVLVLCAKWRFFWRRLALPLVDALLTANPAAAQRRVFEGLKSPLGLLPLEISVLKGWDATLVGRVAQAWPGAATCLEPATVKLPKAMQKKIKKDKEKAEKEPSTGNSPRGTQTGVELVSISIGTGSLVGLKGVADVNPKPETTKGLRWLRKAAEACTPKPSLDVMLLLPKPSADLKTWTSGKDLRVQFEGKASTKAAKLAKKHLKKAAKLEKAALKSLKKAGKRAGVELLLEAATILKAAMEVIEVQHVENRFVLIAAIEIHGTMKTKLEACQRQADEQVLTPALLEEQQRPLGDTAREFLIGGETAAPAVEVVVDAADVVDVAVTEEVVAPETPKLLSMSASEVTLLANLPQINLDEEDVGATPKEKTPPLSARRAFLPEVGAEEVNNDEALFDVGSTGTPALMPILSS